MARPKQLVAPITRLRQTVNRKNLEATKYRMNVLGKTGEGSTILSKRQMIDKTAGFNQQYLLQKFPALFSRKTLTDRINGVKSEYGYNYFNSLKDYRNMIVDNIKSQMDENTVDVKELHRIYDKQSTEEYNQQLKELAEYLGIMQSELGKGDIKSVSQLSKLAVETREIEVDKGWGAIPSYSETREWSNDDWRTVDRLKEFMVSSNDAIDLMYYIKQKDVKNIENVINIDNGSGLSKYLYSIKGVREIMNGD